MAWLARAVRIQRGRIDLHGVERARGQRDTDRQIGRRVDGPVGLFVAGDAYGLSVLAAQKGLASVAG